MKRKNVLLCLCIALLCSIIISGCGKQRTSEDSQVNENIASSSSVQADESEYIEETTTANDNNLQTEIDKMNGSSIKVIKMESESLKQNKIGDSGKKNIFIYLPESYSDEGKPMPVVYFLHGLDDSSCAYANASQIELDLAFDGNVNEFIMVFMDGNNLTGGSFYVNSPASGNWEDFITKEVVDYVDNNFNTIADKDSRCIMGFSMGGYGALNIALNHPDIFSSLIIFSPGVYADGQIQSMWTSWTSWNDVKLSYAQAFSPNDDSSLNYGNIPEFSGTEEDNRIVDEWDHGYGCLTKKIEAYKASGAGLNGIQINYSDTDSFKWIPKGCLFLADLFDAQNISYEINEYTGGHMIPVHALHDYLIPFTEKYLSF